MLLIIQKQILAVKPVQKDLQDVIPPAKITKKKSKHLTNRKKENKKKIVRSFGNNEFNILGNQMRYKK